MAKSSPGPDLKGALEAMRREPSRGRGRKGPIYKWMAARYDALSRQFAHEPPSWVALARYFADHGLMTAAGLPPTPEILRSTWNRVSQDAKRRRLKPEPQEPQDTPPADVPRSTTATDDPPASRPTGKPTFTPAGPKTFTNPEEET
jgi:hypothetical protein